MLFFFNDTATTEIYTLSLHDALPIYDLGVLYEARGEVEKAVTAYQAEVQVNARAYQAHFNLAKLLSRARRPEDAGRHFRAAVEDRKSTRLNSSHANSSSAVFCLKKKR